MRRLSTIADDALLERLHVLVDSHRRTTADLIAHLSEVDARRLHVNEGFSSLFGYCVEHLGFSEDEACRRIEAARLACRFPEIYSLLECGGISLTVLGLLKHHLTAENHRELLAGVSRQSVRQAKEWLAAQFPVPDVPSSIRKLPERHAANGSARLGGAPAEAPAAQGSATGLLGAPNRTALNTMGAFPPDGVAADAGGMSAQLSTAGAGSGATTSALGSRSDAAPPAPRAGSGAAPSALGSGSGAAPPASERVSVEPLSRDRFLVKFTASRAMREKLALACDLLRHANPGGDLSVVLERALDLLVAELEKRKQGRVKRPRSDQHTRNGSRRGDHGRVPDEQAAAPGRGQGPTTAAGTGKDASGAAGTDKDASTTTSRDKDASVRGDATIARSARREVVARDGWRCSFVSEAGRRCDARAFVEFDHENPRALGGTSEPESAAAV